MPGAPVTWITAPGLFGVPQWGMTNVKPAVLAGLVLLPALISAPLHAQEPALRGVYGLAPDRSDDVGQAIREATEGAGFFVRTVGRRMLADRLAPPDTVRIVVTDTTASITSDGSALRTRLFTVADPGEADQRPPDGVRTAWDNEALVRTFEEDDGVRTYRYSLAGDGDTLRVDVSVEGSRLPRPVEYRLIYRRR